MHRFRASELRAFRERDWSLPNRLQDDHHRSLAERGDWAALLAVMDALHANAELFARESNAVSQAQLVEGHLALRRKLEAFERSRVTPEENPDGARGRFGRAGQTRKPRGRGTR